ncbi:MAG: TrbI/VirB10 family protein [Rhodocyclaceae bacterium]|nr:TrbI/VirB10 family protein [Rhodocyclaceae bacterium]MCA3096113.1 TrbI/VirB10 family protein [Rhodocyclaceae bacterium]MCA3096619.1 TrbI/VirB10 family protein [Rhodocyclaceae bacterium]MCA3105006.1 TrbI/VirB10 family protein [Rhodocyclaceae bacterium]MCA3136987.1 TrbI/VirB10 family protein [Rhodocyclaceae bacterium]
MVLLALPMLAWQAFGTDESDGSSQRRRGSSAAPNGSDAVRPPESTSALERSIHDQARRASLPALPPLPPLPPESTLSPDASRSSSHRLLGTGAPGATLPTDAGRSARPSLAPDAVDPSQSRQDALAAEQERRVAEARSSPMLAIGSVSAGAGPAAAIGSSAAALAAMVRDSASSPADRRAVTSIPPIPVEALVARTMTSGDTRSDSVWLEQARTRRPDDSAPYSALRPAAAGPVVLEGTVIPAVLLTEINSDLPGTLVAQVTQDIWDSVHGRRLLVPKGSRLVGDYNSDVRPGQERVLAAFRRLILPDGSSIDLLGTQATDAQGRSGMHDRVDRHFWTMFGSSFIVAALASLVQRREALPSTVIVVPGAAGGNAPAVASAAGNVLVETSRAILGRSRNIAPTLLIGQGHRFSLTVQRTFSLVSPDDGSINPVSR